MKIIKQIILFSFSLLLHSNVIADDEFTFIQPTLTIEQAVIHAKDIIVKGDCINCEITGVSYEFINNEWIIYVSRKNGPIGSDFYFFMNDKDPSIYRIVGGA